MSDDYETNSDPLEGAGAVVVPLVLAAAAALVCLIAMVAAGWPPIN